MRYTFWLVLANLLISHFCLGQRILEKLPPGVNTDEYDESAPILSKDGKRLFFTRTGHPDFVKIIKGQDDNLITADNDSLFIDHLSDIYSEIAGRTVQNPVTSLFNQDIWVVPIDEDSIGTPFHPGYPLNNALPNSLVSTGMLPDEFVVINQFYDDGSMYSGFSRVKILEDGQHTFPQPMHIYEFNVSSSDVNLTMSPGGHFLIISMERPDSKGKNDLYVSFYMRDNVWSAPQHMGDVINTEWQETTPHVSPDKRFLYFSSNRPGGVGGNDIYVSERLDYTWVKWSQPVLVKGDINSTADDSQPAFTRGNNYMYFTSKRDGSSDIFRVRLTPLPKLKKAIYVKGKIVNSKTGLPIKSELVWGPTSAKDYLEFFSSYNGSFEAIMTEYEPYKFLPRKPGHKGQNMLIDPRILDRQGKDTLEVILYLDPKELGIEEVTDNAVGNKKDELNKSGGDGAQGTLEGGSGRSDTNDPQENDVFFYDINFVKAKATILTKSANALQDLLRMMEKHPTLEILIEGHTDNVGDEIALINLSEQRAAAVRDYLVAKGIERERISIKGLGATRPRSNNDTEEGREKNRRVEISILKK